MTVLARTEPESERGPFPATARSFFIETWGCQMNDLDTQRLSGQLRLRGWVRTDREEAADLVLLNTCSIRERAEKKVYDKLHRLRSLKDGRGTMIGVAGCVAQQEGESILERLPFVDFVMGPGAVGRIDEILDGAVRLALDFPENRRYDHVSIDRPSPMRAQITVIEGCNKNCTFCIVPMTRGREISRPIASIVAEARHAVETGRVEMELLGQTVNAYRCPETGAGFGDLLAEVASVPGVKRVRYMTAHPAEVDRRMIEAIRDHENVTRFVHLPAQSGSSRVLRRMKRLYSRERYLEILSEFRREIPDIVLSTDFIVGFPGETEADFLETLSLMEEVRFGALFAFAYSPRPATPALRIGDPVDEEVSRERLHRLFALHERIEREVLASYAGRTVRVLVEGESRNDSRIAAGRTDQSWTVNFSAPRPVAPGEIVNVRITDAGHHTLKGELA